MKISLMIVFVILIISNNLFPATIAYLFALEEDLSALKQETTFLKTKQVGSRTITILEYGDHRILATRMRSGCVQTAISVEAVTQTASCDYIFSIGPAGSLTDSVAQSSWYYVSSVIPYQFGTARPGGFINSQFDETTIIESQSDPLKELQRAGVASGETFVASSRMRETIFSKTQASIVDMNSSGLVIAASNRNIPLIILRIVSDNADDDAQRTFQEFSTEYNGEGARLFLQWMDALKPSKAAPDSYSKIRELLQIEKSKPENE